MPCRTTPRAVARILHCLIRQLVLNPRGVYVPLHACHEAHHPCPLTAFCNARYANPFERGRMVRFPPDACHVLRRPNPHFAVSLVPRDACGVMSCTSSRDMLSRKPPHPRSPLTLSLRIVRFAASPVAHHACGAIPCTSPSDVFRRKTPHHSCPFPPGLRVVLQAPPSIYSNAPI